MKRAVIAIITDAYPAAKHILESSEFKQKPDAPGTELGYDRYVVASYVKWLAQRKVKVVAVELGNETGPLDEGYLRSVYEQTDGLLLPGGGGNIVRWPNHNVVQISKLFLKWSEEERKRGGFYPIWGTCRGFEIILDYAAKEEPGKIFQRNQGVTSSVPAVIKLHKESKSKILKKMPKELITFLDNKGECAYYYCLYTLAYDKFIELKENNLKDFICSATSYFHDDDSQPRFTAMIENKKNGWYGTQFHLEKAEFEHKKPFPNSKEAIQFSRFLAEFFVKQVEKSSHRPKSKKNNMTNLLDLEEMDVKKAYQGVFLLRSKFKRFFNLKNWLRRKSY